LRREGHAYDLGPILRHLLHLVVALVGDIPVEECTRIVDEAPTVAALRREGHGDDPGAVLRELLHLVVAFVRDVPVEECALVVDDTPTALRWEGDAGDLGPV